MACLSARTVGASWLVAGVNRGDAERQRFPAHVDEAGGAHRARQILLHRESARPIAAGSDTPCGDRSRAGRQPAAPCGSTRDTRRARRPSAASRTRGSRTARPARARDTPPRSASARLATLRMPNATIAPATLSSASGSSSASAVTGATSTRGALLRPARSIGSAKSAPSTSPRKPAVRDSSARRPACPRRDRR